MLTFLDPLGEIRPPSHCSKSSSQNDDAAQEQNQHGDFQKSRSPKKSKKTPQHENYQDKLYQALTANLKQYRVIINTILSENPDMLFLVSVAKDFSAIPEEFKLEAKADAINLIRKYKKMRQPLRPLCNGLNGCLSMFVKYRQEPSSYKNHLAGGPEHDMLCRKEKGYKPGVSVQGIIPLG